jgi:hypothetical protein
MTGLDWVWVGVRAQARVYLRGIATAMEHGAKIRVFTLQESNPVSHPSPVLVPCSPHQRYPPSASPLVVYPVPNSHHPHHRRPFSPETASRARLALARTRAPASLARPGPARSHPGPDPRARARARPRPRPHSRSPFLSYLRNITIHFIYLFIYLFICLFVYLFVYLFIYLFELALLSHKFV